MTRRIAWLVAGSLAFWLFGAYLPATLARGTPWAESIWDADAVLFAGVAVTLCLVPGVLTFLWAAWAARQTPNQQLVTAFGGTGVRMAVALGVGLMLYSAVPALHRERFWYWVLAAYLFTLALEMVLLVARGGPASGTAGPAAATNLGSAPQQPAAR